MARAEGAAAEPVLRTDGTLIRCLAEHARTAPDRVAMREKDLGIWQELSWSALLEACLAYAAGMEAHGFGPGDTTVVLGDNRARLYMGMLATQALDGQPAPVFPDATSEELQHVIEETGARFLLSEDQEQVDKALRLDDRVPSLARIFYDDRRGLASYADPRLVSWQAVREAGARRLAGEPGLREALVGRARPDGPAVFVHSSGTMGKPKGMRLTHRNVLASVSYAQRGDTWDRDEEILSFLPMAWMGDFGVTVAAGIALRFVINIPERQETVLKDLREIAPTFYLASPRTWDNMLTTIQVGMENSTRLKKRIYDFFMGRAIASERRKLEGKAPTRLERLLSLLGELLVFGPIKDQLGLTRMRRAFTGGEAIGEDTFVFYRALGVNLRQIYGQTEACTFVSVHGTSEVRLHTVGKVLPGMEARISERGEILVKGESVFGGYHGQPEETREALEDGWLHTGDAGYLEPDGALVVLGRLAEVKHTARGERYIPNYIENRLKFSPFIKDVAIVGDGREMLTAIVCIDREAVGHWAEVNGLSYVAYADLAQKPEVFRLIGAAVEHVNEALPAGLKVRRFVNLHKELDADDGEITRTRKLRRKVIEERYAPIIEAMYGGEETVSMKATVTYESGETGVSERRLSILRIEVA